MRERAPSVWVILWMVVIVPTTVMAQEQIRTLVVDGHKGSVPVTQMNGRNYVEIEALAQALNGSLRFDGNQIALMLPSAGGSDASTPSQAATGFSREFLRAGIEAMSAIREWHSVLASAVENQYPFTQNGLGQYQAQAMTNLRLAQAASATDADQKAAQLLASEWRQMKQLSDKYLAKRANMVYVAPDALRNDNLNQSIIACGKSLGAMAASGQLIDDGTCR